MEHSLSRSRIIGAILLLANLALTCSLLSYLLINKANEGSPSYLMYIGTNDKDTNKQEIPIDDCESIITKTCLDYVDGFTLFKAKGAWKDETGTAFIETSFVCSIMEAKEEAIYNIADVLLDKLNQSSILIDRKTSSPSFYSGR